MSVYINGKEFSEEIIKEQEELLDEYAIMDSVKDFINSKLPANISYFDTAKLDGLFREIDKNNGQSEDYAYVMSSIIVNIGNAVRQPLILEGCFKNNIRYKGQILTYYNNYKNKIAPIGREKIRHSIEAQFQHFEINPVKIALNMIVNGTPLKRLPLVKLNIDPSSRVGSMLSGLIDAQILKFAVKYYDLLEAVRVYKRASQQEYDWDDFKTKYVAKLAKDETNYFYDMAFRVLQDMLKVYDEL